MKHDVRTWCLALVQNPPPRTGRGSRPLALGWKLENGLLPKSELQALYEAFGDQPTASDSWTASGPLRALLTEYHAVLRGRPCCRAPRKSRRATRPAHSA